MSSENSLSSDVTLLSNNAISTDSGSGHLGDDLQEDPDKKSRKDISDWINQLDALRRKLVELKKNRCVSFFCPRKFPKNFCLGEGLVSWEVWEGKAVVVPTLLSTE